MALTQEQIDRLYGIGPSAPTDGPGRVVLTRAQVMREMSGAGKAPADHEKEAKRRLDAQRAEVKRMVDTAGETTDPKAEEERFRRGMALHMEEQAAAARHAKLPTAEDVAEARANYVYWLDKAKSETDAAKRSAHVERAMRFSAVAGGDGNDVMRDGLIELARRAKDTVERRALLERAARYKPTPYERAIQRAVAHEASVTRTTKKRDPYVNPLSGQRYIGAPPVTPESSMIIERGVSQSYPQGRKLTDVQTGATQAHTDGVTGERRNYDRATCQQQIKDLLLQAKTEGDPNRRSEIAKMIIWWQLKLETATGTGKATTY